MTVSLLVIAACAAFAMAVALPTFICRQRGHVWRVLDEKTTRVCKRCYRVEYFLGGKWVPSFDGK
jgi:predicted RecB family nuclease